MIEHRSISNLVQDSPIWIPSRCPRSLLPHLHFPFPYDPVASQDLETFNHTLTQYVTGFSEERDGRHIPHQLNQKIDTHSPAPAPANEHEYEDLRGHLVISSEPDRTMLGDLDHEFKITEDSTLNQDLPENVPVVMELPLDYDTATAV